MVSSASPCFAEDIRHEAVVTYAHALIGFLALMDDERFDPTDKLNFRTVVEHAVKHYGVTPGDIAREFEFHASTPSRWLNNRSLPQPVVRKLVIAWIKKRLEESVKEMTPSPDDLKVIGDTVMKRVAA